jgi:hypothetical protein
LVVEDGVALVEQTTDQGAFAIIHTAAGDEPQGFFVALAVQKDSYVFDFDVVHQK